MRNENLELLVLGRPDRGLNYYLLIDNFNTKPLEEKKSFINEICDFLNITNSIEENQKRLNTSELILAFLEIPYNKSNNKIEVEALSRNNLDINKCDTYLISIDAEKLIECFGSSNNKLLAEDDELGNKVFDAIYQPKHKFSKP